MSKKLTLTIQPMHKRARQDHMEQALQALAELEIPPTGSTVVTLAFTDDEALREVRERIHKAFAEIPLTVSVSIKVLEEEEVLRGNAAMEELWDRR